MMVRDWMSQPVVSIGVEDTMQRAIELMKDFDIGTLPSLTFVKSSTIFPA